MMRELIPIAIVVMGGLVSLALIAGVFVTRLAKMKAQTLQRGPRQDQEIARLEMELAHTRDELNRLAERQQFVEQLLEKRPDPAALR